MKITENESCINDLDGSLQLLDFNSHSHECTSLVKEVKTKCKKNQRNNDQQYKETDSLRLTF